MSPPRRMQAFEHLGSERCGLTSRNARSKLGRSSSTDSTAPFAPFAPGSALAAPAVPAAVPGSGPAVPRRCCRAAIETVYHLG